MLRSNEKSVGLSKICLQNNEEWRKDRKEREREGGGVRDGWMGWCAQQVRERIRINCQIYKAVTNGGVIRVAENTDDTAWKRAAKLQFAKLLRNHESK